MLKPLPVKSVSLYLLEEDGPAAGLALAECGVFDPRCDLDEEQLPQRPGAQYQVLYRNAQRRLERIRVHLSLDLQASVEPHKAQIISLEDLRTLDLELENIWRECASHEQEQRTVDNETRTIEQLGDALEKFEALNVDLGLLRGGLRFLDVRIGTVARADVARLGQALGLIGYSLTTFIEGDDTAHVAVAGLLGVESALEGVLASASFRPLPLPDEFHDTPRALRQDLDARRTQARERQRDLTARLADARERFSATLGKAANALQRAASYAQLGESLQSKGGLACANGWVPADRVTLLQQTLQARLGKRVMLEARDPLPEEWQRVPTVIRYPRFMRPFAALVRNYGIPRYGEFDPTWLFALTYIMMFGMMFGDVGQGAVIFAAGLTLPNRWATARPFVIGAGIASTGFGVLYGSVFGYEDVLHPVWMSPLSDPMHMLLLALAWGVGFILIASIITVRNRLAEKRYREALVDGKGLAGIVLYAGVLIAAWQWVHDVEFERAELVLIGLPLFVIFTNRWAQTRAPFFERLLVVVLEIFESFMSYIANTLSFLRVAAFSLNHVALAIAVFTLARMMESTGHLITVVLGNVFILVVEGAIVAIQVLRLEYYEGFSRFFTGDGTEFRPITLGAQKFETGAA